MFKKIFLINKHRCNLWQDWDVKDPFWHSEGWRNRSPFPVTWHRFSGSEYPQTMFIFKDKKRATWLFSRNSIICRISLKFSTVIIKVNRNEQFSNFLRKGIQYTKNNVVNKRIRDQFHNCEPNYCYIWIVRTVFFFSTNLKE